MSEADALTLDKNGAQRYRSALSAYDLALLTTALAELPPDRAGIRVHGLAGVTPFLVASGAVGSIASASLGPNCRPVRALLLDKSAAANWSLGWHQDRTIVVAERREAEGFGPWSVKAGLIHVAPPVGVLQKMLTLRVHLDPVGESNAPLLIAPGSHAFGRVPEPQIADVVRRCGRLACVAEAGDVWAYSTLILHASEAAAEPAHRRVLQVDYSAEDLPGGLQWRGV